MITLFKYCADIENYENFRGFGFFNNNNNNNNKRLEIKGWVGNGFMFYYFYVSFHYHDIKKKKKLIA